MTDGDALLGPAITGAIRFLRKIYRDIGELLATLDGEMAERGWRPTEATRVSWALSNGLDPDRWTLGYVFRFYHRTPSLGRLEDLVAFVVLLEPPAAFDEPVMLGAAARFANPAAYATILDQWKDSYSVVESLRQTPGPRTLSTDEVSAFLPAASQVVGTAVPLCGLGGIESLLTQLVDPLMGSLQTPGH